MNLKLFQFAKRVNATSIPVDSTGTDYDVVLKEDTGRENPSFLIDFGDTPNMNYNYCKFNGIYYFINDIILRHRNIYELVCSIDVLATYRNTILNSQQYVLRSASESDEKIIDVMYPCNIAHSYVKTNAYDSPTTSGTAYYPFASGGVSYVVGVVGYSDYAIGSVTYYWMDQRDMTDLLSALMSNIDWLDISTEEMVEGVQKLIMDPAAYIVSCVALPFARIENPTMTTTVVRYGWYNLTVTTQVLANFYTTKTAYIKLPKHPKSSTRGKYLNSAPYSRYSVEFEPFGVIPLDPCLLVDTEYIKLEVRIDLITGDGELVIKDQDSAKNQIIAFATGRIGMNVQLSRVYNNPIGVATSVVGGAVGMTASALTGNVAGIITSSTSGIMNSLQSMFPQVEKVGVNGSKMIQYITNPLLHSDFVDVVDENNDHLGRPLCKTKTLSSLHGYCLCQNSAIAITGPETDADAIKNYLDTGVFIY